MIQRHRAGYEKRYEHRLEPQATFKNPVWREPFASSAETPPILGMILRRDRHTLPKMVKLGVGSSYNPSRSRQTRMSAIWSS